MMRSAVFAAVALLVTGAAFADTQKISSDGVVHRVESVPYVTSSGTGSAIRHTTQTPSGGIISAWVPGTDDLAADRDPALEIDPSTGAPVLVWSRNEGSGYCLFFSRYGPNGWAPPRLLVRSSGDDFEPEIHFGASVLHVGWRQQDPSGASALYRSIFDAVALTSTWGPERVPLDDPAPVPPSGCPAPSSNTPSRSYTYFRGTLPGHLPGDPGVTYVWGVRDEPVPISFRQSFILPSGVKPGSVQGATFLGGRFTYWFVNGTGDALYYTVLGDSSWSAMRIVVLGPQTSAADARNMIHEFNRRSP